jgi:transposase
MIAVGIDVSKGLLDLGVHQELKLQQYKNTRQGIAKLVKEMRRRGDVRILVEATGGYEEAVLEACAAAGLWICRVNPRQVRDFAKATGQLAKTDALDARVLAEMMAVLSPRLRRHEPAAAWGNELKSPLRRRNQLTEQIIANTQQLATAVAIVARGMKQTLAALKRERGAIDVAMKQLLVAHATPAMRSGKGMGPMFQAALLALLPELGHLDRKQIAKLVGVAPMNRDSGKSQGKRTIYGGRAQMRVALYMATLSAVRWEPEIKAHYDQLRARGKIAKVALVACMRKLLGIVNARRRSELRMGSQIPCAA